MRAKVASKHGGKSAAIHAKNQPGQPRRRRVPQGAHVPHYVEAEPPFRVRLLRAFAHIVWWAFLTVCLMGLTLFMLVLMWGAAHILTGIANTFR